MRIFSLAEPSFLGERRAATGTATAASILLLDFFHTSFFINLKTTWTGWPRRRRRRRRRQQRQRHRRRSEGGGRCGEAGRDSHGEVVPGGATKGRRPHPRWRRRRKRNATRTPPTMMTILGSRRASSLRSRARTRWRSYSTYRPTAIGVRRATALHHYRERQ